MKKILIIILTFFLCSCYNYVEINNLSFISAIGIDYQNEMFELSFEILNTDKTQKQVNNVYEKGNTIASAFDNIDFKIDNKPFYYHLKTVIISKEVAQKHLQELTDYLARSPEIRNEFFLVVANNTTAKSIIDAQSEMMPIIGDEIANLIENSKTGYAYQRSFEDLLEKLLNRRIDMVTSQVSIKDNILILDGISLFKDYQYIGFLPQKDIALFNILSNNPSSIILNKTYIQIDFIKN